MTAPVSSPIESTVEKHIDSTSRRVRHVDIAFSLLIVISLLFVCLFLAVIADHWLLKEGLSIPLRLGIFTALFFVAGLYVYWRVVPLFRYSINPVYTADLIERDVPTFKNSLINWLLLRHEREERISQPNDPINERIYRGVVRTAAAKVQTVPTGHAVDIHKLIWVGTFFAVVLILFIAYAVFSPKNPYASLVRVLFPFGGIDRPQAAQFRNIIPGNAVVLQGERLTISAEVFSRSTEPVYLVFSTDDGQAVNQWIPMLQPEGKIAFETPFPPGKQGAERGFHSSVDYRIMLGESQSKQFRIDVQPAASVEIMALRYDFPEYTGLPPEVTEHGGDVRTLEGTMIAVTVRSTLPLQKIDIVFDENPASNVPMRVVDSQNTEAKGTFTLKTPFPHKTFSFRATDENGNASRRSGIYRIEVIPDQPPKVQWADTAENLRDAAQIDLPLNETLQLPIQAEDPDFALRYLRFKTESPGKRIPDTALLDSPTSGPTLHRGQISKTVSFSPAEKRLAVGDTAEVWAEAIDTKLPEANASSTRRIKIKVIPPKAEEEEEQQQKKGGDQDDGQPQQDDNQEKGADKTDDNTNEKDPNKEGNEGDQGGGERTEGQDPNGQQNPNEGEQSGDNQNKEEENKQDPNKNGESEQGKSEQNDQQGGTGEQEGNEEGDSQQGAAGDKPGEGGEQGSRDEPQNGQKSDSPPENQPAEEKQQGKGAGGERTDGEKQRQDASVNPETQDGDAMERIVEQMKDEGLFPSENPFLRNDNNNRRSDSLDPNSPNQTNRGNDPTNPMPSNRRPEEKGQNQPQNQPDKPKEGESKEGNKPDSGQSGDMNTQSGNQHGNPQNEQSGGAPNSQGAQDHSEDNSTGNQQGGQQGDQQGREGSADQQPKGNDAQDGESGNQGLPGGTGGGDAKTRETAPDDPNLKHANEVTNMVLDYLENQLKDKPNDELLKKLGWSEDQLRQFYDKWKQMSDNNKQTQPREDGKNPWEEALKSIGLVRPQHQPTVQGSQTGRQDNKRVTEAQRPSAPAAIRERFRMYNDNVGK